MSEMKENFNKLVDKAIGEDTKKTSTGIIMTVIAVMSVAFNIYQGVVDRRDRTADRNDRANKEKSDGAARNDAFKMTQMEAVSKVLPFIADSNQMENALGLITLITYKQDTIALRYIRTGLFSPQVIMQVSKYGAQYSTSIEYKKQFKKSSIQPGDIALMNAIQEKKSESKDSMINGRYRNAGRFVRKYNAFVGLNENNPWAASFICWCYNKDFRYFESNGSIYLLEKMLNKKYVNYTLTNGNIPNPGDIYFYDWKYSNVVSRAIGLVDHYSGDTLYGIEGNSSENNAPPYYEVAKVHFPKEERSNENFKFISIK